MRKLSLSLISALFALTVTFGFLTPALADTSQVQAGLCTGANLQFTETPSSANCTAGDATSKINNIIHTIINLMSAIVGIVAVVMIIVGGLRYITSGGNDTSVTSAKNTILYAIIGLVVVALAQTLVRFTLGKITNG